MDYKQKYLKYKAKYLELKNGLEGGARPSPTESSTKFKPGTKKRGNDGNMWEIIRTASGVNRWKKIALHKGLKKYMIHDNGDFPFLVYVGKNTAHIYKKTKSGEYTTLVKDYAIKKAFIGKDREYGYTGNSILLHLKDNRYVFIGWKIYEFKPKEEITHFWSIMGNSDVSYPVALSKTYAYMMLDGIVVKRNQFSKNPDWPDAYSEYYGWTGQKKPLKGQKVPGFKIVHGRNI